MKKSNLKPKNLWISLDPDHPERCYMRIKTKNGKEVNFDFGFYAKHLSFPKEREILKQWIKEQQK